MTLVVARRFENSITIVSDTRITKSNAEKIDTLRGAIVKSITISPYIALSFAGDELTAGKVIQQFADHWTSLTQDEIVDQLLSAHIESSRIAEGITDFIVAFQRPTRLVCIKDYKAEDTNAAWIGDPVGFAYFQQNFRENGGPSLDRFASPTTSGKDTAIAVMELLATPAGTPENLPSAMKQAMQAVIAAECTHSVGGFPVVLVTTEDHFQYGEYISVQTTRMPIGDFQDLTELPVGNAAAGNYTCYFFNIYTPQTCIPCMFFPETALGIIFRPHRGILRSTGIFVLSFEEFLWAARDGTGLRVTSNLPGAEDLRKASSSSIDTLKSQMPSYLGNPAAPSRSSTGMTISKRPALVTNKLSLVHCEPEDDRSGRMEMQVMQLHSQGRHPIFIHKASGRRSSMADVFRRATVNQPHIRTLASGKTTQAVAYLIFDKSTNSDHYMLSTTNGNLELKRLVIHGEVAAM